MHHRSSPEGAEATQAALNTLDQRGVAVFETCGNTLEKLLVLLGDRLRQDITYPMTTASTPAQTFLRAYFADHAVFNTRAVGPARLRTAAASTTWTQPASRR
ncbi:MAG: hypothetical protein IPL19_08950 [Sandaracinaceae bacterium]|nr:hypothetical protein [Sandaracinaceae bacterium]